MVFIKYILMHKSMDDIGDILHWFFSMAALVCKIFIVLRKQLFDIHISFRIQKLCLSEEGRHILCLEEEICQQIMVSCTCLNVCTM